MTKPPLPPCEPGKTCPAYAAGRWPEDCVCYQQGAGRIQRMRNAILIALAGGLTAISLWTLLMVALWNHL